MLGNGISFVILILFSSSIWPVTLLMTKKGARPEMNGMMISGVTCVLSGICAVVTGTWSILTVKFLLLSIMVGIAYSVGFCYFIFNCLKIGPSGLTTMINNLGVIGAILVGIAMEKPTAREIVIITAGVILVLMSFFFINGSKEKEMKISRKWLVYVSAGGILSAVSFAGNAMIGKTYSDGAYLFSALAHGTSVIVLASYSRYKKHGMPNRYELLNGTYTGIVNTFSGVITFALLTIVSPVIVYSMTTVAPIVLMLLIGHFFLKERLTRKTTVGAVLGVLGITVLTLYQ